MAKVLVFDEDQFFLDFICRTLESSYQVHAEPDLQRLRDTGFRESFDLIILDIKLDSALGNNSAIFEIKAQCGSKVPILTTGPSDEKHLLLRSLSNGANCFLAKPFTGKELERKVRSIIPSFFHKPEEIADAFPSFDLVGKHPEFSKAKNMVTRGHYKYFYTWALYFRKTTRWHLPTIISSKNFA